MVHPHLEADAAKTKTYELEVKEALRSGHSVDPPPRFRRSVAPCTTSAVAITPGLTQFTVMPVPAKCFARLTAIDGSAPFAA